MHRNVPLVVIVLSGLLSGGCGSLGWYRAIGNIPGVAPSDWAFYEFCGTSSQVFQFSVPQVQSDGGRGPARPGIRGHRSRRSPATTRPSP